MDATLRGPRPGGPHRDAHPGPPGAARGAGRRVLVLAALAAALALGAAGAAAQDPYDFVSTTWLADFLHAGSYEVVGTYAEIMGSGACFLDYDLDGWEDLFLLNGRYANATVQQELDPRSALYRNLQGAGMQRVAGALELSLWGMGCAAGDYDNDGDPDVAISTWGGNYLWRNDRAAGWTNVTAAAGVHHPDCDGVTCFGASLAWLDYDLDADLDLYVLNYVAWDGQGISSPNAYPGQCNVLFRNDGNGAFTDVTGAANAADCGRNHLALAIADVDRDGWQDIFIASDESVDTLLRNDRDGTFTDIALDAGVDDPRGGMGAAWGDYDGDGLDDLVITHFEGERFALYRQRADRLAWDDRAGLDGLEFTRNYVGWGSEFVDLDNDGDLDLLLVNGHVDISYSAHIGFGQKNLVLRNDGGTFVDATDQAWDGGIDRHVSRALAMGDLDQDGYLDVVVVNNANETARLHRSARGANNVLALRLEGNATVNPHALGAVVTVEAGGQSWRREVVASSSYLSQSSRDVRVGLGSLLRADRVEVAWPDGTSQAFEDVLANQLLRLPAGGALEPLRELALAAPPREVLGNRVDPVVLEGAALRAPGGIVREAWTFEDHTTAEGGVVERSYADLGTATVTYRVETADGGWDEAPVIVRIGNLAPQPRIAAPATADRLDAILLDGAASLDRDGEVVNWTWTVEGATFFGPQARPTLRALGPVEVALTVRDDEGAEATRTAVVEVRNLPPLASAGPDVVGNLRSTFRFDGAASTDPDGRVVAWAWDFGDGTTAEGSEVRKGYAATGIYEVTLTVRDGDGGEATDTLRVTINEANALPVLVAGGDRDADRVAPVRLDASASYDPDGSIVAFRWDLGDGTLAEGAVVEHTYAALGDFTATLEAEDDTGGVATASVRVRVRNLAPSLDLGPDVRQEGLAPVTLRAAAQDRDGSVVAVRWDLAGSPAEGAEVTHAFPGYGRHRAAATAEDDDGGATTAGIEVWLYARPVARPGPDREGNRVEAVAFDGRGSTDEDGAVVAWRWDFGDGATAQGPVVEHRFRSLGTFPVTLTVVDDQGWEGSATAMVTVVNLPPVATIEALALANVNQSLPYRGGASHDPDGSVVAWAWDFGDGAAAAGPEAAHAYASAGQRMVRLVVTDSDGATASAARAVEVVDWLRVDVAMDKDVYGVWEQPRGVARVAFANGLPAAGAAVDVVVAYRVLGPRAAALPEVAVHLHQLRGTTDAAGAFPFTVPSPWPAILGPLPFLHAPSPGVPSLAGESWGDYQARATAGWRGNHGDGEDRYRVGLAPAWGLDAGSPPQEPAGPARSRHAGNVEGGASP